MLSFLKGTGYSLLQSDFRGVPATQNGTIVQGNIVYKNAAGVITIGAVSNLVASTDLIGIAMNNDLDGDVNEANSIGALAFDGETVIQTDQVSGSISASNYPIGTPLTYTTTTGLFTTGTIGTNRIVGIVEGVFSFPGTLTTVASSGYNSVPNGTAVASQNVQVQAPTTVLTIKLLSA